MPTTAFAPTEPPGAAEPALDPRRLSRAAEGQPLAAPLRRYELSTTGGSEVLMRVIGLVRSRCGEIMALDFHRGDRHRPPVLEITVAIDRRHGTTLALRLAGLIDVLAVREY
jgi:acetolactate synthase regulatory subunit